MKLLDFEFNVPSHHPSLPGHFPGNPVVPGVLLLDHVLEAVHRATSRRAARLQQVKFMSALRPDERAHGQCELTDERAAFRVTARRGGVEAVLASGVLFFRMGDGPAA